MRISSVEAYRARIPFRNAFAHALQRRTETDTLILLVRSDTGEIGVGEILPRPYLTGETMESVVRRNVPELVERWADRPLDDRTEVVSALQQEFQCTGQTLATFAGWESAILDLAGKAFGFPAGDVLGPVKSNKLAPGVVIDFGISTDRLLKYCILVRVAGRRHVKVKVGLADDLRRLELIKEILTDQPLRIDANGSWTATEAIAKLRQMARFNLRSVEQPVNAHDLAGMRKVREGTGLLVVADESLCSVEDAHSLIAAKAADVFNIRPAKCGGLFASMRLVEVARNSGLRCDLGTLVGETGILSRVAEIFGERVEGFEFLDGKGQNTHFLLYDLVQPPAGDETRSDNGLGIRLAMYLLKQSSSQVFRYQCHNRSIA